MARTARSHSRASFEQDEIRSRFGVIRQGIEEGRKTFANTVKYVLTTMSANMGNMIGMAAASLFLPFLPLLAGQILLNHLLSDVPAIGIAGDAVDRQLIARPPRWNMRFIGGVMLAFGAVRLALRFPEVRRAPAGVPRGPGPVQNRHGSSNHYSPSPSSRWWCGRGARSSAAGRAACCSARRWPWSR